MAKINVTIYDNDGEELFGNTREEGVILALGAIFQECLNLVYDKSEGYGDAWREQGWMGNLACVMSKTARLRNLNWRQTDIRMGTGSEMTEDTVKDLINIAAFLLVNLREGNRWGQPGGH